MCDLIIEHATDPHRLDTDPVVQAAAQRWIEVLGEAASKLSVEVKMAHPEVPWRDIVGTRVILGGSTGDGCRARTSSGCSDRRLDRRRPSGASWLPRTQARSSCRRRVSRPTTRWPSADATIFRGLRRPADRPEDPGLAWRSMWDALARERFTTAIYGSASGC
ncbi:DUF86 domain-containing protein [Iamia sp.]|uniref:HepT-like ribonuclease domain-containing protein n=1 Tax=Iamia sp. TaxID=2722710 RepID=UPI002C47FD07|nr:HepT-like ribonuclease domain-containing protein [Iamia sp.]HXH56255.1 HepT-like ribonuclease domain-containing protein [Iamia sp.]